MTRILVILIMLFPASLPALEQTWYGDHEEGWFWYQDPVDETEDEARTESPQAAHTPPPSETDPLAEIERIQTEIARLRARALLDPTPENMRAWLEANDWQLQQAATFADAWRRTVWQNPDLDYRLRRPTMAIANQVFLDRQRTLKTRAVADIARTHGLFFFFKSTCPYCHKIAPILRRLSEQYGLEVLPISLDGGALPDYPEPRMDNGMAAQLGIRAVPALYLVDPGRRDVIPVGFGLLSEQEIVDRIYVLTQTKPGEDF